MPPPGFFGGLFNRASRETGDHEPLLPRDEPAAANTERIARCVGRLKYFSEKPGRLAALVRQSEYQDLDAPTDSDLVDMGEAVMAGAITTAARTSAGKIIAATGIPGASNVPGLVNAGHTLSQSVRLHQLADEVPASLTELATAIRHCAHMRDSKSGGQAVTAVVGVAAAAAVAVAVVAPPLGVPAALIVAAGTAGSTAAGVGASRGLNAAVDWHYEINRRSVARILVDHAVDADAVTRNCGRRALELLQFPVAKLEGIEPPGDHDDPHRIEMTYQAVERLL